MEGRVDVVASKEIVDEYEEIVLRLKQKYPRIDTTFCFLFTREVGHFHYLRNMADYYRHFKGGKYKLLGIAKDSETLEKMVVYKALYGEGEMWVRPYDMFFGTVERDGKVMQRFTKITEEEAL